MIFKISLRDVLKCRLKVKGPIIISMSIRSIEVIIPSGLISNDKRPSAEEHKSLFAAIVLLFAHKFTFKRSVEYFSLLEFLANLPSAVFDLVVVVGGVVVVVVVLVLVVVGVGVVVDDPVGTEHKPITATL